MDIEIAEFGKMSQSGSSLLSLIQNNDLPILDLLVREAVQNSLDAGIDVKEYDSVYVDIGIKDFNVTNFTKHLSGVDKYLNKKFGSTLQKAIYIEDTNTTGLTGSLDFKKSPHGNIFKLIYGISMAQESPGAGGSWGLGKTVYFRVGIGLVVYYSRIINEEGSYENRLAVTLVENEKLADTIIPSVEGVVASGIAWWGERVNSISNETIPITNGHLIQEILSSLSIDMFKGTQTGTKVIIPFINEQQLLIKKDENPNVHKPWDSDVLEYIRIAMQRWYAPRLANHKYHHGKFLDGHINGSRLEKQDFLPLFIEMQIMYNIAANSIKTDRYFVEGIFIKNYFDNNKRNNAGKIVYKKFSNKEFSMVAPTNSPNPLICVNKKSADEQNPPLIAYVRKPGMIINYETNGEWGKGIPHTEKNEFLVAVFVPNSDTKLISPYNEIVDLESYLRKSEKADHTSWTDLILKDAPIDIVSKIRSQVARKIKMAYEESKETKEKKGMNQLARNLGKTLLPPIGFGRRASSRNLAGSNNSSGNRSTQRNKFKITSQNYLHNDLIEVDFELTLAKEIEDFDISLYVWSEVGRISASEWEGSNGIGKPFPAHIVKVEFSESTKPLFKTIRKNSSKDVTYAIVTKKDEGPVECTGTLTFSCKDPYLQFEVAMVPEGRVDNDK